MLNEQVITRTAFARPSIGRRVRRVLLTLVSLLVLLTVGTGAAYITFVNHPERSKIKQAALLPSPDALSPGETLPTREAVAGGAQNILLIGSDTGGSLASARAGVIVLAHISSDRRLLHLMHFPGNLYVDVPGYGEDRIDAAFALGGPQLLVRTLQRQLDVPIDHVAVISYEGFREMTDLLGGVDVIAEQASSGGGYSTVRRGVNHLDGAAALGFVRERQLPGESDISRGRRQLAFIKALLLKSLTTNALANPIQLAQFMDVAGRSLTVDDAFSVAEMGSLTAALRGLASKDIVAITAPISTVGISPQGASVDFVDAARMAVMSEALKRDGMASFPPG